MKVKLLEDRVLVRPVAMEEKTDGGIILPDTVRDVPMYGEVVATGPGAWRHGRLIQPTVRRGDIVMFSKHAGADVEVDGEHFILLYEREIMMIFVEDKDVSDS